MKTKFITGLLVIVAALSGYLLALHGEGAGTARAQSSSGNLICKVPQGSGGDTPIVLVDTESQRVVVYEYDVASNNMELAGVRPYMYDVEAGPYNNRGPTVREVQMRVQQQQGSFRRK